jgi:CheY-like chemotaxis protein
MKKQEEKLYDAERISGKGLKVLLVDDDEICLFIHRRVLELSGSCSSTPCVTDGKKALEFLHRVAMGGVSVPDIILLDLEMPVMNGIAFLEEFERVGYRHKLPTAIVLLTSSVSENDKQYAMSLGVSHYLAKPFTLESFNAVVHLLFKTIAPNIAINSSDL